ncbi:hypothetical protein ASZ90_006556 [hydrocarbon metagenome]|uniref:Uncharacterized protein n=1 Tax=hydrocarbon metagenome TaxID=938273 RepID=A0A0W8FRY7_9ZZZZ
MINVFIIFNVRFSDVLHTLILRQDKSLLVTLPYLSMNASFKDISAILIRRCFELIRSGTIILFSGIISKSTNGSFSKTLVCALTFGVLISILIVDKFGSWIVLSFAGVIPRPFLTIVQWPRPGNGTLNFLQILAKPTSDKPNSLAHLDTGFIHTM